MGVLNLTSFCLNREEIKRRLAELMQRHLATRAMAHLVRASEIVDDMTLDDRLACLQAEAEINLALKVAK